MDNEGRTATDLLLKIEEQNNTIIRTQRSIDLNIKILSNKINQVIETLLNAEPIQSPPASETDMSFQDYTGSVDIPENIPSSFPLPLPIDTSPVGFRRTSRPETYVDDRKNAPVPRKDVPTPSPAIPEMHAPTEIKKGTVASTTEGKSRIPIMQRIVDRNSKAIFNADVEIVNSKTHNVEVKTKTNGVGKWQASLAPGAYRINLRKPPSMNKPKIEISQDLVVDGSTPNELQILIVK